MIRRWMIFGLLTLLASCEYTETPLRAPSEVRVAFETPISGPLRGVTLWLLEDNSLYVSADTPVRLDASGTHGVFDAYPPPPSIQAQMSMNQLAYSVVGTTVNAPFGFFALYRDDGDGRLTLPHPGQVESGPDDIVGLVWYSDSPVILIPNFQRWFESLTSSQVQTYYRYTSNRHTPLYVRHPESADGLFTVETNEPEIATLSLMCPLYQHSFRNGYTDIETRESLLDSSFLLLDDFGAVSSLCLREIGCTHITDITQNLEEAITQFETSNSSKTLYCSTYDPWSSWEAQDFEILRAQYRFSSFNCNDVCLCEGITQTIDFYARSDDLPSNWPCSLADRSPEGRFIRR